jgi:hypothetical protein
MGIPPTRRTGTTRARLTSLRDGGVVAATVMHSEAGDPAKERDRRSRASPLWGRITDHPGAAVTNLLADEPHNCVVSHLRLGTRRG